jgi:hypothetical protein
MRTVGENGCEPLLLFGGRLITCISQVTREVNERAKSKNIASLLLPSATSIYIKSMDAAANKKDLVDMAESNNRRINEAVANISRVSAEFGEALSALRIHALNQEKDKLFWCLNGNTPRKGVVWLLTEANFDLAGASVGRKLAATTRPQFPAQEFDDEPIGLNFMHYQEWDKLEEIFNFEAIFSIGDGVEPRPFGDETVGMLDGHADDEDIGPATTAPTTTDDIEEMLKYEATFSIGDGVEAPLGDETVWMDDHADDEEIGPATTAPATTDDFYEMLKYEATFNGDGVEPPLGDETVGMDDHVDDEDIGFATAAPTTDDIEESSKEQKQAYYSSSHGTSTINGTANDFSNEWNGRHFSGLLEGASPHGLGGTMSTTMSTPVAQQLVGWISSRQAATERYRVPTASQNLNRTASIAVNPESSRPHK